MNINGYDSNSISTLFSSLPGQRGAGSVFTNNLYSSLSDYKLIKSGTYGKLINAYYQKQDTADEESKVKNTTKQIANIENEASALSDSAKEIYKDRDLFKEKSDGSYDMDKIYDAVSAFVDDYNSAIKASKGSDITSIANAASSMVNLNTFNSKLLSKVGIQMDAESLKLSIDEDKFKKADISSIKSLFQGTGSYAYQMGAQASMMNSAAKVQASKSNTYTGTGSYDQSLKAGSIYDSLT